MPEPSSFCAFWKIVLEKAMTAAYPVSTWKLMTMTSTQLALVYRSSYQNESEKLTFVVF